MIPHGTFIKDLQLWPGWMDMFVVPQDSVALDRAIDDVTMAMRTMRGLRARPEEQLRRDHAGSVRAGHQQFHLVARVL